MCSGFQKREEFREKTKSSERLQEILGGLKPPSSACHRFHLGKVIAFVLTRKCQGTFTELRLNYPVCLPVGAYGIQQMKIQDYTGKLAFEIGWYVQFIVLTY